jgi:hypothetical protein
MLCTVMEGAERQAVVRCGEIAGEGQGEGRRREAEGLKQGDRTATSPLCQVLAKSEWRSLPRPTYPIGTCSAASQSRKLVG